MGKHVLWGWHKHPLVSLLVVGKWVMGKGDEVLEALHLDGMLFLQEMGVVKML